jgi:hypothetical protein
MMKIARSVSAPDSDLDPHQNVMDPQHWFILIRVAHRVLSPPPPLSASEVG